MIANDDDIIKPARTRRRNYRLCFGDAVTLIDTHGFIELFTEADLVSSILINWLAIAGYTQQTTASITAALSANSLNSSSRVMAAAAVIKCNATQPIGLVVAGIAALVAGIILLIANWEEVTEAVGGFFSAIKDVGMDLINGLIDGIKAAASGIWNGIKSVFTGIIDAIKGFFGIHSPSTVFASLGGDMIQGLINGILSAGAAIWNAVKGVFTGLWDNIKNVFSGAWDLGKSVVSAIGDGIKGVASGAVDLAKNAGSAIVSGAKAAGSAIASGAKAAGSAIASGASAVGGAVASGASAVASGAGKVLKKLKFWDVGSPNISADHIAMVHKGERIVPKTFNQDLMSGNTMMLAPEALSSIMASFTGLGRQSINISGVVPVMINDREIGRAAFEWLDVAAGGAYGY